MVFYKSTFDNKKCIAIVIKNGMTTSNNIFGLVAGNGFLPRIIADEIVKNSEVLKIFSLDESNFVFFKKNGYYVKQVCFDNPSDLIKNIKNEKVNKVVCCGGIKFENNVSFLSFLKVLNLRIIICLIRFFISKQRGDNFLLSLAENILKSIGCEVVAVQNIVPSLLTSNKDEVNIKKAKSYKSDIEYGVSVLKALSKYDIGQAVVVQNGRVVGIEGIEGTAKLIDRCGSYAYDGKKRPVLIKMSKIGQNRKLDLPSIGVDTIKSLAKNNYAGIAIERDSVLLIQRKKLIKFAKENDIFIKIL